MNLNNRWLALSIGNTHHYWAIFRGRKLIKTWKEINQLSKTFQPLYSQNTDYLLDPHSHQWPELWLASVVPQETKKWLDYPHLHLLNLADVPLQNCYPTLGVDRALGAWGAGVTYGWPVLLIDGGTALTITGVDATQQFQGGLILPGLGLMAKSLETQTAALSSLNFNWETIPPLWGNDTPSAIQAGIFWTVLSGLDRFIQDWLQEYPTSQVTFTGGDGEFLKAGLLQFQPKYLSLPCHLDPHVIFWGIAALGQQDP
ncbi:pantothenate kinase [Synechococcus sp. PCC 6312]|uniref:pantothenate kinase n=1 Tax=Synechococcus sp. (strain ATCC 27167 / PCC 6312) TaxID=195253 RepID=UPI00029F41F9|nr:pantothenate kinase [Synechococcus sp. PCC 6312]AFY60744.1 pantothenate kinase, type III [Synechococcus sp. PCC 6312]